MLHPHPQIALADAIATDRLAEARRRANLGRARRHEYTLPIVREIPRRTPEHDETW